MNKIKGILTLLIALFFLTSCEKKESGFINEKLTIYIEELIKLDLNYDFEDLEFSGMGDIVRIFDYPEGIYIAGLQEGNTTVRITYKPKGKLIASFNVTVKLNLGKSYNLNFSVSVPDGYIGDVYVLGDFNNWDLEEAIKLTKSQDGKYYGEAYLKTEEKEIEYKYFNYNEWAYGEGDLLGGHIDNRKSSLEGAEPPFNLLYFDDEILSWEKVYLPKNIKIYVEPHLLDFYKEKVEEYVASYKEKHGQDLDYYIEISDMGSGDAASMLQENPPFDADLFSIMNADLEKLINDYNYLAPIQTAELLAQVENDNYYEFIKAATAKVLGEEYVFGVPYIAQTSVLYYNKHYISDEQVKTWEGIMEAAQIKNRKATVTISEDGYNNAFLLLAKNAQTNETTLRLPLNGSTQNAFATGDDTISVMSWGQQFFNFQNGGILNNRFDWEHHFYNGSSISVIGASWNYEKARKAIGRDVLGIAPLPKFKIKANNAYGSINAGTLFQSGAFAEVKMFVVRSGMTSEKQAIVEEIAKIFTSKEVQEEIFSIYQEDVPAYKNANEEFSALQGSDHKLLLARTQIEVFKYATVKPTGSWDSVATINYYSSGGPQIIADILRNTDNTYSTKEKIKEALLRVENIWKNGEEKT